MSPSTTRSHSLNKLNTFALFLALGLTFSCSKKPTDTDTGPTAPADLTATPDHAIPGATVAISGTTIDTSSTASYRLLIGGQQTLLLTDTSGNISGFAPLFFADSTSTWPTAPAGALDIELYRDTVLIGKGVGVFTLDSLPPAPGSTETIVINTIAAAESFRTILNALAPQPGLQQQMAVGLLAGLDSLLYGRGDSSLTSLLNQLQSSSPEALAFLDAVYGAAGSAEKSQQIADAMAAMATAITVGPLGRGQAVGADVRLAAMMQFSSMMKLFGDAYIHGAAQSASNFAFVSGWVGFVASLTPPLAVINVFISVTAAATSIMDLIFNKMIVATMPTVLDSLTLSFASDTIGLGDTTVSTMRVFARNNPPSITAGDLLSQFLAVAGLLVPPAASLREQMLSTINFVLGQINTALKSYHTSHPEFGYNPNLFDLFSIPIIHWDAEVTDQRLLDLHTTTPQRLAIIDSLLEWRAHNATGLANVTVTPAIGPDAILIPVPPTISYGGTAFGDLDTPSVLVSETHTLTIKPALALLVDFASTIPQNGSNVLGVQAGEISIHGDTVWTAGLDITLATTGGSASPVSGVTGASGLFSSLISLEAGSDSVIVKVTVENNLGSSKSEEVTSTKDAVYRIAGTFTGAVSPGQATTFTASVTKIVSSDTLPAPNVNLTLQATSATPVSITGLTDAGGQFSANFTPESNAQSISIAVDARVDGSQVASETFDANVGFQNTWPASWAGLWSGPGKLPCQGTSGFTNMTIVAGSFILTQHLDSMFVGITTDTHVEVRTRVTFVSNSSVRHQGVVADRTGDQMVGEIYTVTTSSTNIADTLSCSRSTFTLTRSSGVGP